jgi:hypothetical protein
MKSFGFVLLAILNFKENCVLRILKFLVLGYLLYKFRLRMGELKFCLSNFMVEKILPNKFQILKVPTKVCNMRKVFTSHQIFQFKIPIYWSYWDGTILVFYIFQENLITLQKTCKSWKNWVCSFLWWSSNYKHVSISSFPFSAYSEGTWKILEMKYKL